MFRSPLATLFALFAIGLIVAAPANAQDAASAGTATPPAAAETPAEENTGPDLPSRIVDPMIDDAELVVRLLPLTVEELKAAADVWLGIVKDKTRDMAEAQVAIMQYEGPVEDAVRESLTELSLERKSLFENYNAVIDAWEKKGGAPEEIAVYRAYRNAIIIEETRTADTETLAKEAFAWVQDEDGGIRLAIQTGVVIGALILLVMVARLIRKGARRAFGRVPHASSLLLAFVSGVIYWLTIAMGLMIVLSAVGIDISPVFALFGGAAFILAFALQDTLGNLFSGLMIMINRPFDVGEYVQAGGVAGTVRSVSIVSTTVVTPDNQVIIIPNKSVWNNVITNVTGSKTRRVDLVFGIGYGDSIEDAQRVMEETVAAHDLVLADPAPVIRVHELGDSSVNFVCRPWVNTVDYWTVYWDLHRQVKEAFDANGISIPFPQRDVHLYHPAPAAEAPAPAPALTHPAEAPPSHGNRDSYAKEGPGRAEPGMEDEGKDG
jgi:small conductance mechanosensitive channel